MSTENTENQGNQQASSSYEQAPERSEAVSSLSAALGGITDGGEALQNLSNPAPEAPAEEPKKEEQPNPDDAEKVAADLLKKEVEAKKETEEEVIEEPKVETTEEPGTEEPKKEDEEKEAVKINSPLFGGDKTLENNQEKETEPLNLENAEQVNSLIKEKTGFDDLQSLIDNSAETKEKLSNFEKVSVENEQLKNVFANMPTELYQAVDSFLKGNDWKTPIMSKPNLDFTKDVADQDTKSLVEQYFPGQISAEEWENYNSDDPDLGIKKAIDMAIENAKSKFGTQKTELDNYRQNEVENAQAKNKAMNDSVTKSIAHLEQSIEGLDKGYVSQVQQGLTVQGLNDLYFNQDGTFKEDAALNYVMAKQGFDLMNQYKGIAMRRAETKERTKIIERTPDKPKPNTKAEAVENNIRPEVQQHLSGILDGTGKPKTY